MADQTNYSTEQLDRINDLLSSLDLSPNTAFFPMADQFNNDIFPYLSEEERSAIESANPPDTDDLGNLASLDDLTQADTNDLADLGNLAGFDDLTQADTSDLGDLGNLAGLDDSTQADTNDLADLGDLAGFDDTTQ
ncbi:MAG: hypothetical protein H3C43_06270, partial [Leptonema sp. (in: Bacteria)]|nr:hypothetical protein [Leptonema sp. (in: bacteria)]